MEWQIHDDGTFDLMAEGIGLQGAYPAIDGQAVHPLAVEIEREGVIRYQLPEGVLTLRLGRDEAGLTLSATLIGPQEAPHRLAPLAGARITGAERFFRQGLGTGGPTEFVRLASMGDTAPVTGFTVSALCTADDSTLTLAAYDQRRFSQRTLLYPAHAGKDALTLDAEFALERIPLPATGLGTPTLHFRWGPGAWQALQATAAAIGHEMGARQAQPTSYHWCSWYYLYQNFSEALLDEYLQGLQSLSPKVPLQSIQVDAGYFPAVGDWLLTNHLWPHGMAGPLRRIQQAGYRAGIWVGPFMVGNRSRLYAEHPDWILCDREGRPITPWRWYGEQRVWGNRDEETYVLDSSHPEAFAYLRRVFRTFRSYGATLFKTDFMLWGLHDSTRVRRHTPGKTSVEYLRDVLAMIREEIGEDSYWLGCIAPFAPFIGYADGMRIGGDVGESWAGSFGPRNMLRETVGSQYFNQIWWQNDPDAIMLRDFHIHLSPQEVRSLALWQGILGGVVNTSCPLHEIAPDRLRLWRFLEPGAEPGAARIPYWGQERKLRVAVRTLAERCAWALLALNTSDEPQTEVIRLGDALDQDELYAYRWGPEGYEALGRASQLVPELPAHEAALYYLSSEERPPAGLTLGGAPADF